MLKELVLLTRKINGLDDPEKVKEMGELLEGIKLYVENLERSFEFERKKNQRPKLTKREIDAAGRLPIEKN